MKESYKSNKFKISSLTWNEEFELFDGSYSMLNIQDYFKYIFKKCGEETVSPSKRIYVNKIENRTTIKIKTQFYPEVLTTETKKLLRSTKSKITKNENGKNMFYFGIIEVVLI